MRLLAAAGVVCALVLAGQPAPASRELTRAAEEITRIRALVEAGALPRVRLEQAERTLADAQDDLILHRTLYGEVLVQDLTEAQGREMVAAAKRRIERVQARLDDARRLVEEGVAARATLTPLIEDLDLRRKTLDLAQGRAQVLEEIATLARAEADAHERNAEEAAPYDGDGGIPPTRLKALAQAFERQFARVLPVSAHGATALHRALGYDHRDRVDVALNPDHPEGVWLRRYLDSARIPYIAFRGFVAGKSTAAHIHIGSPSARIQIAD